MGGEGWEPSLESQGEQPSVRTYLPSPDLRTSSGPFPWPSHTAGYTGPSLLTQTAPETVCGGYTQPYRPNWVPSKRNHSSQNLV